MVFGIWDPRIPRKPYVDMTEEERRITEAALGERYAGILNLFERGEQLLADIHFYGETHPYRDTTAM